MQHTTKLEHRKYNIYRKKCIHTLRKIKRERRTNLFQYTLERYGVRDLQVQLWERNRDREREGRGEEDKKVDRWEFSMSPRFLLLFSEIFF